MVKVLCDRCGNVIQQGEKVWCVGCGSSPGANVAPVRGNFFEGSHYC